MNCHLQIIIFSKAFFFQYADKVYYILLSLGLTLVTLFRFQLISLETIEAFCSENALFELLTILFLTISIYIFFKLRKYMFAIGSLFFFLEEISYGQWIYAYTTPKFFEQINTQSEVNFHNIDIVNWLPIDTALTLLIILYALFGCYIRSRKLYNKLAPLFLFNTRNTVEILTVFLFTIIVNHSLESSPGEEIFEFTVTYLILKEAIGLTSNQVEKIKKLKLYTFNPSAYFPSPKATD